MDHRVTIQPEFFRKKLINTSLHESSTIHTYRFNKLVGKKTTSNPNEDEEENLTSWDEIQKLWRAVALLHALASIVHSILFSRAVLEPSWFTYIGSGAVVLIVLALIYHRYKELGPNSKTKNYRRKQLMLFAVVYIGYASIFILLDLSHRIMLGLMTFYMTTLSIVLVSVIFMCYSPPEPNESKKKLQLTILPIIVVFLVCLSCKFSLVNEFVVEHLVRDDTIQPSNSIFLGSAGLTALNVMSAIYQQLNIWNFPVDLRSAMVFYCEMICVPPITIILDYIYIRRLQHTVSNNNNS